MAVLRRVIFATALMVLTCRSFAQTESTPPEIRDSTVVDSAFSSFVLTPDSANLETTSISKRWLYPVGIIVMSGAAFFGLYFIRSR